MTFEVFIRPTIRTMTGARDVDRPRVPVVLEHDIEGSDRIEFQRGIVSVGSDGRLTARNTGRQASSRLASFLGTNALIVIPPREHTYVAGESVTAMMLDAPFGAMTASPPHGPTLASMHSC